MAVSSGSGKDDMAKLKAILDALPTVRFICLDVANGYSEAFVSFVRSVRDQFPEHVIIVCSHWPIHPGGFRVARIPCEPLQSKSVVKYRTGCEQGVGIRRSQRIRDQ
jgi:hypothetical protein